MLLQNDAGLMPRTAGILVMFTIHEQELPRRYLEEHEMLTTEVRRPRLRSLTLQLRLHANDITAQHGKVTERTCC